MIRKFKALGLSLVAVFALSAVAASAAWAVEDPGNITNTNGTYPVELHAEQVSGEKHVFTLTDDENLKTECTVATFVGQLTGTSSTATAHPTYEKCTAFLGISATVDTSKCDYTFHIGNTIPSTTNYDGTVTLVGAGGSANCIITITSATCQVTVEGPQTLSTIEGINMAGSPEDVTVKAKVTGIKYKVTNDGFLCPLKNGQTSGTQGDYTGNTTLTGKKSGVAQPLAIEMGAIT